MFLPESRGFRVTLHCGENWDDMARWDWWTFLVYDPPFAEGFIRAYVETLFWGGGFGKCVGHIRTEDEEVFRRRDRIEQSRSCLVDAVGVRLIEDLNRT